MKATTTGTGLYRGVCVDNQDPDGLGRIRVQVPQILGSSASGWAFPAWSFHDLTIWPQDRLPKPGDGVWVMFESTSPDKMIWVAAFGPVDLINQPGFAPDIDYDTTVTMVTPVLDWNDLVVFSGTLDSTGGGIPNPNPKIFLYALPDGGDWTPVAVTKNVNGVDGSWSIPYRVDIPGSVTYKAVFPGVGVYGPSESTEDLTDTGTTTGVSTPSFSSALYRGNYFTLYGTVTAASGERVISGYTQLWWRPLVGADTSWRQATTPKSPPVVDGTYTLRGYFGHLGPTEWQVRYFGGAQFGDSVSDVVSNEVVLSPGPALAQGGVSHTSAAFSWGAITGATAYDIQRRVNYGSWSTLFSNQTSRSVNNTGLSNSVTYQYRVRPRALDPAGTTVYGAWGPVIRMNTGRPKVTDSGETGLISISVLGRNSHSITGGWRNDNEMRQGFFSSSYGGEGYIGIAYYGGTRVRDKVRAACGGGSTGTARQENGSCFYAEVYMGKEGDVGNTPKVTVTFYTSDRGTSGSRPNREGSGYSTGSTSYNESKYYPIGTAHGQRLGDAQSNSLAIYRNDKANYAAFRATTLRLKWRWNYTKVSYVAPKWF